MTKCPYCGFDPMEGSLRIEGAPCGVLSYDKESKKPIPNTHCSTFTCCQKTWNEHCKKCHPEYLQELEQQEIESKYQQQQEQEKLQAEAEEVQRQVDEDMQAQVEAEAQAMEEE
jgi:hypothetical protein